MKGGGGLRGNPASGCDNEWEKSRVGKQYEGIIKGKEEDCSVGKTEGIEPRSK